VDDGTGLYSGASIRRWLEHCTTSRNFAGSIPDGVMEISDRTVALRFSHPLKELRTMNNLWWTGGVRAAGAFR
jgi:hypothetical protein